jgi:hypothetical protein
LSCSVGRPGFVFTAPTTSTNINMSPRKQPAPSSSDPCDISHFWSSCQNQGNSCPLYLHLHCSWNHACPVLSCPVLCVQLTCLLHHYPCTIQISFSFDATSGTQIFTAFRFISHSDGRDTQACSSTEHLSCLENQPFPST